MTTWSQPATNTITVAGAKPDARPAISHPLVQRRVMHSEGLDWLGTVYPHGSVVALAADRAYPLELSGHLAKLEGQP